ncbi:MAG TPA: DUF1858 domain-containing protein [Bacteroidales bacterium]|nr:DUF1858 domain-containing protein [Bacteroidales bacterium]
MNKPVISPKTKVGELLDAYPELEAVLMELSPAFHKLKNPVLRKTVARVATLQQISVVGGIPVENIISRLRHEAGQDDTADYQSAGSGNAAEIPAWFDEKKIVSVYDATEVINSGESPMAEVLKRANGLNPGEILELRTPFIPAPILDMLKTKMFRVFSLQHGDVFTNYISR